VPPPTGESLISLNREADQIAAIIAIMIIIGILVERSGKQAAGPHDEDHQESEMACQDLPFRIDASDFHHTGTMKRPYFLVM
jgi:hypothetical protein